MTTTRTGSAVLRSRLDLMFPVSAGLADRISSHPEVAALYPELLFLLYSITRSSVRLLETAERHAAALAETDPVAAALVPYFRQHAAEELHHDEWVLEDYAALGRDAAELASRPPSPTMAELTGSVYFWIMHHHPVAALGYFAAMEGMPPTVEMVSGLQARTGYPPSAFRALHHHAAVDPHHGDELWALIDGLGLNDRQMEIVTTVAMHSVDRFVAAQQELLDTAPAYSASSSA